MYLKFTAEQEHFRKEVVDFLLKETPPEFRVGTDEGLDTDEFFAVAKDFAQRLAKKGWLVIGWPKEYGGGGASHIEQAILNEQLGYFNIPPANSVGLNQCGPTIIKLGTEGQKMRYLPPIANGEKIWCQGFTEPNAGSDLAAIQTTAIKKGDHYVVNGQKIYTSRANWSDYCYLLARTNPNAPKKHDGLSMFLVDMKSPGIEVRPLFNIAGSYRQNEVFFDDVTVPAENLVGDENNGWRVSMSTLDFERSGVGNPARYKRVFEDFLLLCTESRRHGKPPFESEVIRHRLAQCAIELDAWRLLCWRIVWMQSGGLPAGHEGSMQVAYGKDFRQRFAQVIMQVLGQYGLLDSGSPLSPMEGRFQRLYMVSTNKHGMGTAEIQRSIIALRGLGLPR